MMMENIHEFCANAVRFSGELPEATVGVWVLSGVLMLVQVIFLIRRAVVGKPEPEVVEIEVEKNVFVPYVPGNTVLKLSKLLREQENGWKLIETVAFGKPPVLAYGNISMLINPASNQFVVKHKGVDVNIYDHASIPIHDQTFLSIAFYNRVNKERAKAKNQAEKMAYEAEQYANSELASIISTL